MSEGALRLGVAGCGRIAERGYVPAALATEGVTIAAFADPELDRRERCRELWRGGGGDEAAGFAGVEELLRSDPVDLLVLATPAATHAELAEAAAAAGVRCLVEKPPAPGLAGARRLAALAPEPHLAFNRRFLQGVELGASVPAGCWVELDLELRFRRAAWGAHEARDEALLDAGIHLIDLASHLTGADPISVRRAEATCERAEFELELSRGRGRIRCATDSRHREVVAVRDRGGKLLARSVLGGVRGRLAALAGAPDLLVLSLQRQLAALRDGGRAAEPVATAEDGVRAMAIVEAVRRSAELEGAEVTVGPVAEVAG